MYIYLVYDRIISDEVVIAGYTKKYNAIYFIKNYIKGFKFAKPEQIYIKRIRESNQEFTIIEYKDEQDGKTSDITPALS